MSTKQKLVKEFQILGLATLALYGVLIVLSGCQSAPPSDQQLKDQAAQTTEQVRKNAKEAAADAKVAAANAERQVNAIADGVKEGMKSPASSGPIDINSASPDQLATLPGISGDKAQDIVSKRPYSSPHSLVSKGLISETEYHRISAKITAS
ncbi:ComEA family DNA-binding protein [Silvibacterium acidisoli]|uniref:ComEA family DNA-binding protein n=1 Tax=Acidobacteriaceae bacterium ZG23-2 TaxID=2883246 RepID=UPI00406D3E5D